MLVQLDTDLFASEDDMIQALADERVLAQWLMH